MDVDFLVIGGGIAGTSAGAALSALGSVCLLEAESALAHHASGRSAALFEANYGNQVVCALNLASLLDLQTIDGGVLSPRGLLVLAGPGLDNAFDTALGTMDLKEVSLEDAGALFPILNHAHTARAGFHRAAYDIDTDRMVQHYARIIRCAGTIRTNARVTGITPVPGGWQITAGDTITARHVVNAAGAWADQVAAMAGVAEIGLSPLRRSMARMPAPGGHVVGDWPMVLAVDESWYAKPDAGAWLVSPAEEDPIDPPHDVYADDMVLAEGIARYQPFVTEPVTRVTSSWAGLRSFAPDRALVIGPDPNASTFLWCAGQGGYGFQSAPAAAALLADLAAGRPPAQAPGTVAALSPSRFR